MWKNKFFKYFYNSVIYNAPLTKLYETYPKACVRTVSSNEQYRGS